MKTSRTLIRTSCVLVVATALIATGCSKKSETAATPAATAPTTTTTKPAADATATGGDMAAEAKQKTEAAAANLAAGAKAKTDAAAVEAKKQLDAAAAAAKQKAEAAASSLAKPQAEPVPAANATPVPTVPSAASVDPAAATAAAGSTMDVLKKQAEELLAQYSGELATLKNGAATLKGLIDKNSAMLPAGVAEKYKEFNALLPQLSSMVDSLQNYQSADLTTLVPKLKADFGAAQKLYAEIKGMVPAM